MKPIIYLFTLLLFIFTLLLINIPIALSDGILWENSTFNPSLSNVTYRINKTFEGINIIYGNETCITINTSTWCNQSTTDIILNITEMLVDTTSPIISNLRNTSTTNQSSYIEWYCNENCNYSILWYNSTALVNSIYNNTFSLSHNPYLSNLSNFTTYFINLTVWDSSGNSANNKTFNFTTTANIWAIEEIIEGPSEEGGQGPGITTEAIGKKRANITTYLESLGIPFTQRLISATRDPSNGICDDGEIIFRDKDCIFNLLLIWYQMWFIRLLLVLILLMLIKDSKYLPIPIFLFIILMYTNSAFVIPNLEDIPGMTNFITSFNQYGYMLRDTMISLGQTQDISPYIKTPFTQRLTSFNRDPTNSICDDGEIIFKDNDCRFTLGLLIYQMWFIRLLLVLILLMMIRNSKYLLIPIIIFIILMYMNGALVSPHINMPNLESIPGIAKFISTFNKYGNALSDSITSIGQTQDISPYVKTPFTQRLTSFNRDPTNDICDDGEIIFKDKDCRFNLGLLIYQMWFIRALLIIGVLSLFRNSKYFSIFVVSFILIMYLNGVFGL